MKFSIFTFFVSIFVVQGLAQAETVGFFPSQKKGTVLIENGTSADADFFWDIFAVEPVLSESKQTKSFESIHGDFKAVCNRAETTPTPVTSCTIHFASVALGGVITIDKDNDRISGIFSEEIAKAFSLPQELATSPDSLMTFCSVCGMDGAGLPFSIIWQK